MGDNSFQIKTKLQSIILDFSMAFWHFKIFKGQDDLWLQPPSGH